MNFSIDLNALRLQAIKIDAKSIFVDFVSFWQFLDRRPDYRATRCGCHGISQEQIGEYYKSLFDMNHMELVR